MVANDPKLEPPLQALAAVYIAQRNYAAAEPLYQHLLSIQEKAGGPRNAEYAANLTKYAFLLRKLKRKTEAAVVSEQARAASSAVSVGLPAASTDRPVVGVTDDGHPARGVWSGYPTTSWPTSRPTRQRRFVEVSFAQGGRGERHRDVGAVRSRMSGDRPRS